MTHDQTSDSIPTARTRDEAIARLRAQAPRSRWMIKTRGGSETHIGVFIAIPVLTASCVGAVVVAVHVSGWRRAVASIVAVLSGAWVAWVGLLITVVDRVFGKILDEPDSF